MSIKTPTEDGGSTVPGGLGPALPPPAKPWGPLDEKRKRRELEERAARPVVDGYRT